MKTAVKARTDPAKDCNRVTLGPRPALSAALSREGRGLKNTGKSPRPWTRVDPSTTLSVFDREAVGEGALRAVLSLSSVIRIESGSAGRRNGAKDPAQSRVQRHGY